MKGGHTAPRNVIIGSDITAAYTTFNEGGAYRPPKPRLSDRRDTAALRFNEGGAYRPPKRAACRT